MWYIADLYSQASSVLIHHITETLVMRQSLKYSPTCVTNLFIHIPFKFSHQMMCFTYKVQLTSFSPIVWVHILCSLQPDPIIFSLYDETNASCPLHSETKSLSYIVWVPALFSLYTHATSPEHPKSQLQLSFLIPWKVL